MVVILRDSRLPRRSYPHAPRSAVEAVDNPSRPSPQPATMLTTSDQGGLMGYTTDFIGHIGIEPPLNQYEQAYLAAFASSRRCRTRDDPYDVPGNPAAEEL